MPKNTATCTNTTIAGLKRVVEWLTEHPDLPISAVDYASSEGIELTLQSGGYELLAAAIHTAESITGPDIAVIDASAIDDGPRQWCHLFISGHLPAADGSGEPLRILITGLCFDAAAIALRNSLGTPPIPGERMWSTTGDHLRSLLPAGGGQ